MSDDKRPSWDEIKKRRAELLRAELKANKFAWYYWWIENENGFVGGVFMRARGGVECNHLAHGLNLFPPEGAASWSSELTSEAAAALMPEDKYVLLTDVQVEAVARRMKT